MTEHALFSRDFSGGPLLEGSAWVGQNTLPRPFDGALERITGHEESHIEVLLYFDGEPWVYGAYPPKVRKVPFEEFRDRVVPEWEAKRWTRRLGGLKAQWWQPLRPLEEWRLKPMRAKAESLLGIRYNMILTWLGWVKGWMHCSYYAGLVYHDGQMLVTDEHKETPGSALAKLEEFNRNRDRIPKHEHSPDFRFP